ncbi:Protein of unknown function [Gryllus bimaculatus]|nr:Protein of unknown function [Gryllus bimaculatus]
MEKILVLSFVAQLCLVISTSEIPDVNILFKMPETSNLVYSLDRVEVELHSMSNSLGKILLHDNHTIICFNLPCEFNNGECQGMIFMFFPKGIGEAFFPKSSVQKQISPQLEKLGTIVVTEECMIKMLRHVYAPLDLQDLHAQKLVDRITLVRIAAADVHRFKTVARTLYFAIHFGIVIVPQDLKEQTVKKNANLGLMELIVKIYVEDVKKAPVINTLVNAMICVKKATILHYAKSVSNN